MTTPFVLTRDINGYNGFGLMFSDLKYSVNLDANVEATLTVPSTDSSWLAIFSYESGADVWVANNETAEVPAGNTVLATTSDHNPVARKVTAGDILSFITDDTNATVGITLYALRYNM